MTWTLAAESIGKSLGRRTVLTSAGLWASPGKITVLLGRNGSGKTTLVKIAVGWLRPDYGVQELHVGRSLSCRPTSHTQCANRRSH
ncbi:MAG: ATP-binding cassette domain-containing protein [Gemmatimonadales bacterium]